MLLLVHSEKIYDDVIFRLRHIFKLGEMFCPWDVKDKWGIVFPGPTISRFIILFKYRDKCERFRPKICLIMARQKLFTPVKIPKARFLVFTQSCTSVMPVTQDHFYSINATQDHKISYYDSTPRNMTI